MFACDLAFIGVALARQERYACTEMKWAAGINKAVIRRRPGIRRWQPGKLMFGLAALALLTMPIDYHGGADIAHAHAVFQFWTARGHDAADHHHHSHESTRTRTNSHSTVGGRWFSDQRAMRTIENGSQTALTPPPDVPVITSLVNSAERNGPLASAIAMTAMLDFGSPPLFATKTAKLSAASRPPRTPPPRPLSPQ